MKLVSINPSNNEILGEVEETTKEEIIDKINLAKSAQTKWANLDINERIKILEEMYNKFEKNTDKIANLISLEMGKPITQSESEIKSTLKNIKWDLENAKNCIAPEITFENDTEMQKVFYESKGIVVAISPFNYPFSLCCAIAFQNLIVGNVVISKPDQNLPLLYKFLEEILSNTNLPSEVWQFVFGGKEIGSFLVEQEIDMICFTGNTKTGEYLYKVAANKMIPILMELGGSAPGIVCEDADIDNVIQGIFKKKFSNSGQLCHALKRLIVHESIFDEVIDKLKKIAESQVIGESLDRNTTIGPLVNKKQLNTLTDQFDDAINKGAKVICGGKQLEEKYFEPTLLTNITKDMKVWKEEVFGPILPVTSFKTIEEAIELANDTIYGLGGYVFTTNKEKFEKISKELKTGMVACNNLAYSAPYNPFGGVKKSGLGRTRGKWGLRGLCNIKVVTFEK
ncbi:MAG: aldehyde dehydrogenase family protein [Clostridia bacterium]|nr:aldehyde dehydrogenase family protein [Clostridia bacterium]